MKKVLVTGAGGFIGSNMVKFLLENSDYFIYGIDNFINGTENKNFIKNLICERFVFFEDDFINFDFNKYFKRSRMQPLATNALLQEGRELRPGDHTTCLIINHSFITAIFLLALLYVELITQLYTPEATLSGKLTTCIVLHCGKFISYTFLPFTSNTSSFPFLF